MMKKFPIIWHIFVILEKVCFINREFPNLMQLLFTGFRTRRYLAWQYLSRCGLWCYVSSLQVCSHFNGTKPTTFTWFIHFLNLIFSLSSLPNPLWNRAYSGGEEILQYLQDAAHQFGIWQHIRFNTKVTEAMWLEDHQKWEVITEEGERLTTFARAGDLMTRERIPTDEKPFICQHCY